MKYSSRVAILVIALLAQVACESTSDETNQLPESRDEARELLESQIAKWDSSYEDMEAECESDKESALCVEQFNINLSGDSLILMRHKRFIREMTGSERTAVARLFSDGWQDREQVCAGKLTVYLMKEFGFKIRFYYYTSDRKPLFNHTVGFSECQELERLKESNK